MELPLYARAASQKPSYLQPENQLSHLDDRILQLILWTMNSCDNQQDASHMNCSPANSPQTPAVNLKNKATEDANTPCVPETHRKLSHPFLHNLGPPPRPFKKARYAWEIKNYDYTLKKMTQNITHSENASPRSENNVEILQKKFEPPISVNTNQVTVPISSHEEKIPDMQMMGPPYHQAYNMGLLSTPYHAHYGAVMGANLNHQNVLSHEEQLNAFHNQIPHDPDAKLIRWHTRQLCRSIFDNTVNRMLENMGFSPVTDRSQALHPLLVLSLSDDEERESAEEAHQRTLESQALSAAAFHPKGFLPPSYHYDTLESATTSDYDSSEEDSELGEVAPDELADQVTPIPPVQQNSEEDYHSLNRHCHLSPGNIADKLLPYHTNENPIQILTDLPLKKQVNFSAVQNLQEYRRDCEVYDSCLQEKSHDESPKVNSQEQISPYDRNNSECISRCRSLECNKEQSGNENTYQKKMKLDDNENCITSPKQQTLIEGKVDTCHSNSIIEGNIERIVDNCHTVANKNNETNNNNNSNSTTTAANNNSSNGDSSYFIRNYIHRAIKQQGLGFQRA